MHQVGERDQGLVKELATEDLEEVDLVNEAETDIMEAVKAMEEKGLEAEIETGKGVEMTVQDTTKRDTEKEKRKEIVTETVKGSVKDATPSVKGIAQELLLGINSAPVHFCVLLLT